MDLLLLLLITTLICEKLQALTAGHFPRHCLLLLSVPFGNLHLWFPVLGLDNSISHGFLKGGGDPDAIVLLSQSREVYSLLPTSPSVFLSLTISRKRDGL